MAAIATRKWEAKNGIRKHVVAFRNHRSKRTNYFLTSKLRSRIYSVLKGIKKSAPTLVLLGCSLNDFRSHLESQFVEGMSWQNYGRLWHIDHIRECWRFDLSNPEQQRACFHFSNLRPLWAKDNLSRPKK